MGPRPADVEMSDIGLDTEDIGIWNREAVIREKISIPAYVNYA